MILFNEVRKLCLIDHTWWLGQQSTVVMTGYPDTVNPTSGSDPPLELVSSNLSSQPLAVRYQGTGRTSPPVSLPATSWSWKQVQNKCFSDLQKLFQEIIGFACKKLGDNFCNACPVLDKTYLCADHHFWVKTRFGILVESSFIWANQVWPRAILAPKNDKNKKCSD